jgi:hypothetical protein
MKDNNIQIISKSSNNRAAMVILDGKTVHLKKNQNGVWQRKVSTGKDTFILIDVDWDGK